MPRRSMKDALLGGLSPAAFLKRHWQKKPLLVRGAFPDFVDPVSADELAGLAMEAGVRARLVFEKGRKRPWQLEHGPFPEKTLRTLPCSHWTLLVQDVDVLVPESSAILDRFSFVPGWRLDDLMVSFAPEHGTVGPHVDSYDVFLVQGQGRRRWQIATDYDPALLAGVDLKILKRFRPEAEWVLEPGDMLYLPPGVAHYGVALEPCLTYSVGFRAPATGDLVSELLRLPVGLRERFAGGPLLEDPDLAPAASPGEIDAEALGRIRALAAAALADDELLGRWFGAFITAVDPDGLRHRLAHYATREAVFLFVDGEEVVLPPACLPLVRALTATQSSRAEELRRALPRGGEARKLALRLLRDVTKAGLVTGGDDSQGRGLVFARRPLSRGFAPRPRTGHPIKKRSRPPHA